jgi:hypothetical protein
MSEKTKRDLYHTISRLSLAIIALSINILINCLDITHGVPRLQAAKRNDIPCKRPPPL